MRKNNLFSDALFFILEAAALGVVLFAAVIERKSKGVVFLLGAAALLMTALGISLSSFRRDKTRGKEKKVYTDPVTGLPLPIKFKEEVAKKLHTAKPFEYTLVSFDIEKFSYINDILGYQMGNRVLKSIADILSRYCGKSICAARETPDVFYFFTKDCERDRILQDGEEITEKMKNLLGKDYPFALNRGYYRIRDPGEDISILLDRARYACKQMKNQYPKKVAEYTDAMKKERERCRYITLGMHKALKEGEFVPYLQAKTQLAQNRVTGAEVLVRWKKAFDQMMTPAEFIPLFEQNGFIVNLDLYLLEQTCKILADWKIREKVELTLSVNFSRVTLEAQDLDSRLTEILGKYPVNPALLEIEMTESAFAHNPEQILCTARALKDRGFMLALDDFGSGYSSYSMLPEMNADVLKFDKTFLEQLLRSEKGERVIESILALAKMLKIETVAEGVETEKQAELLKKMGCDQAQGFFFGKPMPLKKFEEHYF